MIFHAFFLAPAKKVKTQRKKKSEDAKDTKKVKDDKSEDSEHTAEETNGDDYEDIQQCNAILCFFLMT